jgi:hypothetical protein
MLAFLRSSKSVQAVTFLTCVREVPEVPGLNCRDSFHGFPRPL